MLWGQYGDSCMVAHACHPKKIFVSDISFEKKVSKTKSILLSFRKTLSFRKCCLNKNIFVSKKNYFRFGNTFTFVSETLRKPNRKNIASVFSSWPMRATLR